MNKLDLEQRIVDLEKKVAELKVIIAPQPDTIANDTADSLLSGIVKVSQVYDLEYSQ